MVCLMCTLDAHAQHELYSAAEDSFELDALTPAELTEDNLYASLVPLVQCSASPAEAFAFEQLQLHERHGSSPVPEDAAADSAAATPAAAAAAAAASALPPDDDDDAHDDDEDTEDDDAWVEVTAAEAPLPAALAGVRLECALDFAPCVTVAAASPPLPVLDAVRAAAAAAAAAAASSRDSSAAPS